MTTIAYRDGVLASDSRLTFENDVCTDKCKKLWRLSDGSLYAFAGDNEFGLQILDAIEGDTKGPKVQDDTEISAVRITAKGKIMFSEGERWMRWPEDFIAIGSGGKFALAAMRASRDVGAAKAVKVGIAGDVHSGGRVQQLKLKRTKH